MAELEAEKRQIQSQGRVDVPSEFWEELDLEEGDGVFVSCSDGCVRIKSATDVEI